MILSKERFLGVAACLTWAALVLGVMPLAKAQENKPARVELIQQVQHAVSPPMRRVVPTPPSPASGMIPVRHPAPKRSGAFQPDPVLQTNTAAITSSNTLSRSNFDGISSDGYIPPDTNLAVGDTQVVETVNVDYAVYDKATGALVQGPMAIHNIFAALGGVCSSSDGGDPVVLYDHLAGRWLISQLEYNRSFSSNYECVAISQTSDATGSYYLYALSFGSNLPDYPKWGVWPDAYYLSANIFYRGSTFQGGAACALPRDLMLNGQPISQTVCFQDPSEASFLPADLDGATTPTAGEPEFFANFDNRLELYRFHVDFSTTSNSTFTGPIAVSKAASFTEACGGSTCVPQPGTNQQLDSLGDRLMYRLSYRNFGSYGSLLAAHSVQVSSNGQTGIRWYEVRSPNSSPTAFQQGTYSPDTSTYRWMGSIAQDQKGDIAVGYSVSNGSDTYPGIRYAGRVPSDSAGSLEAENTIVDGTGYQSTYSRWGDYSSMSIDPSNDCTFWYTTEYKNGKGSFNWSTYIASFKFSSCGSSTGSAPAAPTGLAATAGDSQVSLTWNASSGATGYDVLRSTNGINGTYDPLVSGLSSTSYTDTSLTNGTEYCYEVDASNSNGTSVPSSPQCATPEPQTPGAPTGLSATAGDAQVSLTWSASSGSSYYKVYVSTTGTANSFASIASPTTNSYTDNSVTNGTTYYYYVTAANSAGDSGPSNTASATPQAPTTPNAPTNVSASSRGKSGKVNLKWTQSNSPNITQNGIYRAVGNGSYSLLATVSATTSYSDSSTSKGTNYCYEVTAINSSGLESSGSAPSCVTPGTPGK